MTFAKINSVITEDKEALYDICYDDTKDYEFTPHYRTLKRAKVLYIKDYHDWCADIIVFTDGSTRYVWPIAYIKSINISK